MTAWWVEYGPRRVVIEAETVDAADDAAIRQYGRIPDAVYPVDDENGDRA